MTRPLDRVILHLVAASPRVRVVRVERTDGHFDAFELHIDQRLFVVTWSSDDGYCVTEVHDDTVLDVAPDFATTDEAAFVAALREAIR